MSLERAAVLANKTVSVSLPFKHGRHHRTPPRDGGISEKVHYFEKLKKNAFVQQISLLSGLVVSLIIF